MSSRPGRYSGSSTRWQRAALPLVLCLFALVACPFRQRDDHPIRGEVVLWAWQRAEDLSFLDAPGARWPATVSVAPWIGTVRWATNGAPQAVPERIVVEVEPRTVALRLTPGRVSRVVVRLENATGRPGRLPGVADITLRITRLWRRAAESWPGVTLQIDFDAAASEREFYRRLLDAIRFEMPEGRVEMTALLSWCQEGGATPAWLDSLAVDGVVPMAFRLGRDRSLLLRQAAAGLPLRQQRCRRRLGLALDEEASAFASWAADSRMLFLFPDGPWTAAQLRRGLDAVGRTSTRSSSGLSG